MTGFCDGQYSDEDTERQVAEAAAVLRGDAERMEQAILSPDFLVTDLGRYYEDEEEDAERQIAECHSGYSDKGGV